MATVIMASSTAKPLVAPSPPPSLKKKNSFIQLPPFLKKSLPAFKSISLAGAAATFLLPHPALAVEMEKAALFDFNLTLPIIMAEFLLLMVALDKIYYSPLGKFMDDRDADIREKLNSVKDTSAEVKQLEEQGNAIMRAAKAEMAAATAKIVKEKEAELAIKLAEESAKLEKELQEALVNLEAQKEETIKALDAQIAILSEDIISKVIPA